MEETYSKTLLSEILTAIFFLVAMLATSGIAYLKGFYRLEKDEKINIKFIHLFITYFIYLFVSLIIGPIFGSYFKEFTTRETIFGFFSIFNFLLNTIIFCLLAIFCYRVKNTIFKDIVKRKSIYSTSMSYDALIGMLTWFIAFPIVSFFSSILDIFVLKVFKVIELPDQVAIDFIKSSLSHPLYLLLGFISVVFFAPVIEEFLFRGILHNYLKKYLNRSVAIIITSIVFAFFHYAPSQGLSNIPIIGSLFTLAIFLSFLYERQKSLIAPICLHATFNLIGILHIIFFK